MIKAKASVIREEIKFIDNSGDYDTSYDYICDNDYLMDSIETFAQLTYGYSYELSSPHVSTGFEWITAYPSPSELNQNITYSMHVKGVTISSLKRLFNLFLEGKV